jgi:enoyl-CoA hydratase
MSVDIGVSVREVEGVFLAVLDDGRVNAFSAEKFSFLEELLGAAVEASKPLVVAGRPGYFSAGLDLGVIRGGDPDQIQALGDAGDSLFLAMRTAPVPVVAACTGHALAGGSVILMCCDLRLGLAGDYGIGLIEVSAGVPLPRSIFDLAERRLARQYLLRATVLGERWSPSRAVDVGFLDRTVAEDPIGCAIQEARTLSALPAEAYRQTKINFQMSGRADI